MKNKIILSAFALVYLIACAQTFITHYVTADNLNLRQQPNETATVLARLPKGTMVKVHSETGAWAKVTVYDTLDGYVAKAYLSTEKPTQQTKQKQSETTVLICNSKNSHAYHSHYCRGLNRCKSGVSSVTKSQAESSGYSACKICY